MNTNLTEISDLLSNLSIKLGALEYDEDYVDEEEEIGFIRDHLEDLSDRVANLKGAN